MNSSVGVVASKSPRLTLSLPNGFQGDEGKGSMASPPVDPPAPCPDRASLTVDGHSYPCKPGVRFARFDHEAAEILQRHRTARAQRRALQRLLRRFLTGVLVDPAPLLDLLERRPELLHEVAAQSRNLVNRIGVR